MDIPLLITNPMNIRYLTEFVGVDARERETYVLLTRTTIYLFTNSLYKETAQQLSNPTNPTNKPITSVEISREKPIGKELARVTRVALVKKLGFEESDLTVAEYNKLKQELKDITLVPTNDRVEMLRIIKSEEEIENIRQAAKLTDQCFRYITSFLKPGVTESQTAWQIESFIRGKGAQLAFSPIVAFGRHTSQPHYQSQSSLKRSHLFRLKDLDIVLVDFGARVNGYCSDMTRVIFIGKPKVQWRRAYQTVLNSQTQALEYLRGSHPVKKQGNIPSNRSGAVADRIAREAIKKAGFQSYPHSLGHGVGLAIHESPRLTIRKDAVLKTGMVVTVEPAIYVEGSYGIRIEDLVLLKEDGIEVLSQTSKRMSIR